jgi:hypothetical protein
MKPEKCCTKGKNTATKKTLKEGKHNTKNVEVMRGNFVEHRRTKLLGNKS